MRKSSVWSWRGKDREGKREGVRRAGSPCLLWLHSAHRARPSEEAKPRMWGSGSLGDTEERLGPNVWELLSLRRECLAHLPSSSVGPPLRQGAGSHSKTQWGPWRLSQVTFPDLVILNTVPCFEAPRACQELLQYVEEGLPRCGPKN